MEVTSGIHRIDGVNGNSYLLVGKGITLIDTGMPNSSKKILSYIESLGRDPSEVKTIIITHSHIDHTGSLFDLKKRTGAKVAAHEAEADYMSGKKRAKISSLKFKIMFKILSMLPSFKTKPVQPDILLKEGDTIAGLEVIHAPGHTPGSICLYDKARKALFVGDTLRFMNGRMLGPPEFATPDMETARKSIAKIAKMDFEIMLSGHGEPLMPRASEAVKEFLRSSRQPDWGNSKLKS